MKHKELAEKIIGCAYKVYNRMSCGFFINFDEFVKNPIYHLTVIPAKAGIQSFQVVADHLDSGFHRSDDFLRNHQFC